MNNSSLRLRLRTVIFGHDTPAEKAFDVVLILAIVASVAVVMLDSAAGIRERYGPALSAMEWAFTVIFTVEYLIRLWVSERPVRYATSFYGIIDLLSVVPTYLSIIFPGGRFLVALRILRVLRVFRILKLVRYVQEASVLTSALRASRYKITVFVFTVLTVVVVVGAMMYLIEGADAGFTSIPQGIYWAIVTLTTVGYGDIAPQTVLGKTLASTLMILGYGVIAVPTGIVTLELDRASRESAAAGRTCSACGASGHAGDAKYCRICGALV